MFTKIGTTELLLILAVALLILGPTKLPKLGKAIGQTLGNFAGSPPPKRTGTRRNRKTPDRPALPGWTSPETITKATPGAERAGRHAPSGSIANY